MQSKASRRFIEAPRRRRREHSRRGAPRPGVVIEVLDGCVCTRARARAPACVSDVCEDFSKGIPCDCAYASANTRRASQKMGEQSQKPKERDQGENAIDFRQQTGGAAALHPTPRDRPDGGGSDERSGSQRFTPGRASLSDPPPTRPPHHPRPGRCLGAGVRRRLPLRPTKGALSRWVWPCWCWPCEPGLENPPNAPPPSPLFAP